MGIQFNQRRHALIANESYGERSAAAISVHATVRELDGVGGDLLDIRHRGDRVSGLTLADVTGHGREAAPYANRVRAVLAELSEDSRNARSWLTRLNDRLCEEMDDDHFCAALSVGVELTDNGDAMVLSIANAGMPAPLIYRAATRRVECAPSVSPPLGIFDAPDFLPEPTRLTLEPGDLLLLVSDGVIEARRQTRTFFGTRRLERILRAHAVAGGRAVLRGVTAALRRFVHPLGFSDDLSIFVMETHAANGTRARRTAA